MPITLENMVIHEINVMETGTANFGKLPFLVATVLCTTEAMVAVLARHERHPRVSESSTGNLHCYAGLLGPFQG